MCLYSNCIAITSLKSRFDILFTKYLTNTNKKKNTQPNSYSVTPLIAISRRMKGGFIKLYVCFRNKYKRTEKDQKAQSKCSKDKEGYVTTKTDLEKYIFLFLAFN